MIAPAPTRAVVKLLKSAGFTGRVSKGSHTVWVCRSGRHRVSIPDGHKTISPGVHRQVLATIAACTCSQDG
ncbi:type II toxin-antitoxin system HicA family toxin [Gordonia sp. NPDC003424]